MRGLEELVAENPLVAGMRPDHLALISGCAQTARFEAGELILREGGAADRFYFLRSGAVALEIPDPAGDDLVIETLGPGDPLGWSWLFEPYRWHFDARATEPVGALAFDAVCLRGKCADDPVLGYELMRRFAGVLLRRLQSTRLQLVDVYGQSRAR